MAGEKKPKGFASMSEAKQRELASMGGRTAHQKNVAHCFKEGAESQAAGRKGGLVSKAKRVARKAAVLTPAHIELLKQLAVADLPQKSISDQLDFFKQTGFVQVHSGVVCLSKEGRKELVSRGILQCQPKS